jgi:hypothetical protein
VAQPADPSFSILFADLKAGKTTDALAAFPRGVYVAAPGALAPAESVWGFDAPPRYDLETFDDVRAFSDQLKAEHFCLVVDDATLIADRTAGALARKGFTGWDLWAVVLRQAIYLRDSLRRRGIHIVFTCHPRVAHIENGVRTRGGPSFQGQCATKIPAAADFLLHAEARSGVVGGGGDILADAAASGPTVFGWPMVYRTGYSPDWMRGSRYNTPDMAPMNLGEILRLAGFSIPRLRGLEWQDAVAAQLADKLIEVGLTNKEAVLAAFAKVRDVCLKRFTKDERHMIWAIRDGYDRAVLRIAAGGQRRSMWGI